MLVGAPLAWSACTDAWDDHYDVTEGGMADQKTILENIQADPNLANYYQVLKAIGAEDLFASPQQLTVWAPKNLTQAQVDSVIAVYEKEKADYAEKNNGKELKNTDNKAYTQFLQNHTALYTRSISALTDDTIPMLNDKYMHLLGKSTTEGSLADVPFSDATLCSNGMLYKSDYLQGFFPNIREYLEQTEGMDSIVKLITSFDSRELDEKASVPGGVEDGQTVYLDSVEILSNDLLRAFGYIQREDSSYTFIAPTDDLWKAQYEKYIQYYKFSSNVENADSLADIYTKLNIIEGRFFNNNSKYNRHPEDSLTNTRYSVYQEQYPRQNVYYAEDAIFDGLKEVKCSNGTVYVDDKGVITPQSTFFNRWALPATASSYYKLDTSIESGTYGTYPPEDKDNPDATSDVKRYYYLEITGRTKNVATKIDYTVPNLLSAAYYNIYLVTVPNTTKNLPAWMQIQYSLKGENGEWGRTANFKNPHPITPESEVADADLIVANDKKQEWFVASAEKMDTLLVQSAMQLPYSGYSLKEGTLKLTVGSIGTLSNFNDVNYTRNLRLNKFIFIPFETKEEAEAAADDLNAFNDEILAEEAKNKRGQE